MTNPQALEVLPEELAERKLFKAWAIDAGLMTAPDESGLCFKSDACRPAWAAWLMRSTLDATQPAPQPEAQALPDARQRDTLVVNMMRFGNMTKRQARGIVAFSLDGVEPDPADFAIKLASPAPAPLSELQIADLFTARTGLDPEESRERFIWYRRGVRHVVEHLGGIGLDGGM